MLTFIDGEPLKAGLLLRGPTVHKHVDMLLNPTSSAMPTSQHPDPNSGVS